MLMLSILAYTEVTAKMKIVSDDNLQMSDTRLTKSKMKDERL